MLCAVGSALIWGLMPVYWRALRPIDPFVIIFYRILLAGGLTLLLSLILYGKERLAAPLRIPGNKARFFAAGLLITVNWSIFIYAVNAGHVIQVCMGYYIEPLMVSVFGVLFFREKLGGFKIAALSLACAGVLVMLVFYREVPLIALSLALTFALYTALKKTYRVEAVLSLFSETMFLMPAALALLALFESRGLGAAGAASPFQWMLLALVGIATAVPLILFSMGTNRISMVSLGLIEYISPSLTLLLGIFVFREPFDSVRFVSFLIVWVGLAIFTYGEIHETRRNMPVPAGR